jgi:glycosyltransferase involved in cell wall biosynthesis
VGVEIFEPCIEPKTVGCQLVTFFLISYKQEQFIRKALEGAFAQTYQPLEIVLSDDCSPDRTFEIMRQMVLEYKGPHKIVLNQNEHNLGLCNHVNRILDLASGEIVVVAAGDDISLPDRVEKSWRILEKNPDVNCVSFQFGVIDGNGESASKRIKKQGQLTKYSLCDFIAQDGFHLNGPSRAFRKSVYNYFGPLSDKAETEDTTTFLRCLLLGNVCYSSDVGIYYRVHGGNYYASDKKYSINYKRIYWQYIKDVRLAVQRGAITISDSVDLKEVLRRRLKSNMLDTGYYAANSKIKYFLSKLLFSNMLGPKKKLSYLIQALRASKNSEK